MEKKILAFGEIMLRLSAEENCALENSNAFYACYGGTEANVLACLSAFGHNTKYLTALPENELGNAVLNHLNSFGIDTSSVVRRGDILGIYFAENGTGSRGSNVVYMRRYSEFTRLSETDFDFDEVFENVELFHVSGISFALSESSKTLAFRLMKEAKARKIPISFDFNYRSKLWSTEEAAKVLAPAAEEADILLASRLDISCFLKTDEERFISSHPNRLLVLRDRSILENNKHSVKVLLLKNKNGNIERYATEEVCFPVTEKIGGGDAFDGALLHKLLSGSNLKETARFAVSAFALKHTLRGDTFTKSGKDVEDYYSVLRSLS